MGHTKVPFCLQSCVKPLTYAISISTLGTDYVHRFVGKEPSGLRYNTLSLNEEGERPGPRPGSPPPLPVPLLYRGLVLLCPSVFIFGCSRSFLLCRLSLVRRVGLLQLRRAVLRAVASLADHRPWGTPSSAAAALGLRNCSTRP